MLQKCKTIVNTENNQFVLQLQNIVYLINIVSRAVELNMVLRMKTIINESLTIVYITKIALRWTPEGKRKPGQNPVGLRTPWRRTVFKETKKTNYMGRIWEGGWRQWQVEEYSLCPMCHVHCKDKVACDPVGNCISWQGCCIDQRTYEKMIVMFY